MNRNYYIMRRLNVNRLVQLSKVGDMEAMGMILEKFEPMVKSVVAKYYGAWADFEDFMQIGYVGLMQAVFNYKDNSGSKFSTFAYLNISSEIKSFLTYLNRQKNKVLTEAMSIENTFEEFNETSEYYIEAPETTEPDILNQYFINECVKELNDDEKDIINLWFKNYTYKEISKNLNIKRKKVDNTIQKIKRVLTEKQELYEKIQFFIGGAL
ncbi:MAG: sigma-70 family RNA polymerase sigma factor [Thermotogota bacterium]